jgi:hypothetical protein
MLAGVVADERTLSEGFEPPVPCGTLAFKVVDRQFRPNHSCRFSTSITPAGPPWHSANATTFATGVGRNRPCRS